MAVLPIVTWPDPRLTEVCSAVGSRVPSQLIEDMFGTMYAAQGRGLAAPQAGQMLRLFVMDCTWKDGPRTPVVMMDPEITKRSAEMEVAEEGCLSIPGLLVPVRRPRAVSVHWTDENGIRRGGKFDGFAARCIQHELDHLNGTVTLDHLGAAERARAEAEYTTLREHTQ